MLKEAIILAGGFGTRLQSVVADRPKPMALVCGKPFLHYIFKYLKHYKIQKVILSVGHKAEMIQNYFGGEYEGTKVDYALETKPMGTGGGIRLAMEKCVEEKILVLNGDSFIDINLNSFYDTYNSCHADICLTLREVENAARYGTVKIASEGIIINFREKNGIEAPGIINGGVYIINRGFYLNHSNPNKNFSIEKDFFELYVQKYNFSHYLANKNDYFIDIGIPEDYAKAQHDFTKFAY